MPYGVAHTTLKLENEVLMSNFVLVQIGFQNAPSGSMMCWWLWGNPTRPYVIAEMGMNEWNFYGT